MLSVDSTKQQHKGTKGTQNCKAGVGDESQSAHVSETLADFYFDLDEKRLRQLRQRQQQKRSKSKQRVAIANCVPQKQTERGVLSMAR